MLKRIQNRVTNVLNDLPLHDVYRIYLGWSLLEPLISKRLTPDKAKEYSTVNLKMMWCNESERERGEKKEEEEITNDFA